MRALVVTNMYPSPAHPALGSFVRDQVEALRRLPGLELELYTFDPGGPAAYARAAADLRRHYRHAAFDIVHAHYGLTAWPSLALRGPRHAVTLHGTDLAHPRSRPVTLAALPLLDLVATVSEALAAQLPKRIADVKVLPCGVDLERFRPIPRAVARRELGLDEQRPYVLFPASPARPEKRYDRARSVAAGTELLALENVEPSRVPLWVNAANAVLVPSEREGFGLAVLEALACDVPVLATPVGIAPSVLGELPGAFCGAFDAEVWRRALAPHLATPDPRIEGRGRAEPFSAHRMAAQVLDAWRAIQVN